jgi:hypothetical protein
VAGRALTPINFGAQEIVFLQPSDSMPGLNFTEAELDRVFESKLGLVSARALPGTVRTYISSLTGGHVGQTLCVLQWLQQHCKKEADQIHEKKKFCSFLLTQLKSQRLVQVRKVTRRSCADASPVCAVHCGVLSRHSSSFSR